MKKVGFSLIGILMFISCSSDSGDELEIKESKDKSRYEILNSAKEISNYHSQTLDVLYNSILMSKEKYSESSILIDNNINNIDYLEAGVIGLLNSNLSNELNNYDVDMILNHFYLEKYIDSNNNGLVINNLELDESTRLYINNYINNKSNEQEKLHEEFMIELSNLKVISTNSVNELLFSKYYNLDEDSFYQLSIIGYTFIDSYEYWNNNLQKWDNINFFENSNEIIADGYWSGVLRYANKDANGVSKMLVGAALFNAFSGGTGVIVSGPALLIGAGISSAWPD